nr:nucleotidyltransferase domain-containing protein [Granulicella arctica]
MTKAIEFAFVYGSFVRGEDNPKNDIDLMVVGPVTLGELLKQLSPEERQERGPSENENWSSYR